MTGVGSGPGFGVGCDLRLMEGKMANEIGGCSTWPESFELDGESERAAGLSPIPFAYDEKLLDGNRVRFAAAEIEVYQL